MSDREKQIEEMANIMLCFEGFNGCPNSGIGCNMCRATALYNAGYRKIPEDSVILTKEEFWKLSNKFSKKELDEIVEFHKTKARKQSVEEFATKLKNQFEHCVGDTYSAYIIDEKIDEIAEEFEIELPEIRKNTQKHANFENHTSEPDWN